MDEPLLPPAGTPTHPIEPKAGVAPLRGETSGSPSVPDHELFQRIGAGAYGEVWLARNLATGALRAVKIVYRSTFTDDRPFNREFEGLKKFDAVSRSHPSQLALFHVGRNDAADYFYYVMELADPARPVGSNQVSVISNQSAPLRPSLAPLKIAPLITHLLITAYSPHTLRADLEQGRLQAARVLEIALALTEALAHLHTNGLIHRDVKPSNIIFVGGRPKLADIGLVTDASDSQSIVGTEGYLPPEGPGTPPADIFALGKVLYEALTGLDRRQYPELPADLRQWPDAALAFELNTVLIKACAADPNQRYGNTDAMLSDLRLLEAGKSVKRRHSMQRGWTWTWKVAALLVLAGLGFVLIRNERDRRAVNTRLKASPFEKSGTTNYAAWKAFERAGMMSANFAATGFSNAIQELERAVALDPNYAGAWSSLSESLLLASDKGVIPASEALRRGRFCAEQAVKLEPANGWYLHWLGECGLALDYDFARAEPLLGRAVQLATNEAALRHNLAALLWFYGRFDEAEALEDQVILEQPSMGYPHSQKGLLHASRGRFAEALNSMGECILLLPNWPMARARRAEILWALDRRPEAARDWLRFIELEGFASLAPPDAERLNTILKEAGPDRFLRKLIDLLEERRAAGQFSSAYDLAKFHAMIGNRSQALDYLELAVEEHRLFTLSAKVHITFNDFQNEPRYHAVLRRLKLEK